MRFCCVACTSRGGGRSEQAQTKKLPEKADRAVELFLQSVFCRSQAGVVAVQDSVDSKSAEFALSRHVTHITSSMQVWCAKHHQAVQARRGDADTHSTHTTHGMHLVACTPCICCMQAWRALDNADLARGGHADTHCMHSTCGIRTQSLLRAGMAC